MLNASHLSHMRIVAILIESEISFVLHFMVPSAIIYFSGMWHSNNLRDENHYHFHSCKQLISVNDIEVVPLVSVTDR